MSTRGLLPAACPVPPAADPIGPVTRQAQTATRILCEAERLLKIHGHRKITLADIAEACGFSPANLYRYFLSRRAILDALASRYLREAERTALAGAVRGSDTAHGRLSGLLTGLNESLVAVFDGEPQVGELIADASAERWPCYSHYDALVVRHIAEILAEGSASGEFRLEGDAESEARRVKAAGCALVEPHVIRLCRNGHDVSTREALGRLIVAAVASPTAQGQPTSPPR
jgi:AcrR family transcriptional regulator